MQLNKINSTPTIDYKWIDMEINKIIKQAQLTPDTNSFFLNAAKLKHVNCHQAYQIAYEWREITKTFLFTSVKGLGVLAQYLESETELNSNQLSVFQNAYRIIADDLNNNHPVFRKTAPNDPSGIHYRWWEITILEPLAAILSNQTLPMSAGTKTLTDCMRKIVEHPLGVAAQLRVVEAIAYDICIAFFSIFSQLQHLDKKVFQTEQLDWITTHIDAEVIHNQQVCDQSFGMAKIVSNQDEEQQLLALIQQYSTAWSAALADFAKQIISLPQTELA